MDTWQFAGSQPLTLYCWQGAAVEAHATGVGIREARRELGCAPGGWDNLATVCPSWWACDAERPLADGRSWDEMGSRGIDILKKHPVLTGEDMLKGLVREVVGPGTDTVRRFLHVRSSPLLVELLFLWNALSLVARTGRGRGRTAIAAALEFRVRDQHGRVRPCHFGRCQRECALPNATGPAARLLELGALHAFR